MDPQPLDTNTYSESPLWNSSNQNKVIIVSMDLAFPMCMALLQSPPSISTPDPPDTPMRWWYSPCFTNEEIRAQGL
jgi:hypothetical protein